MLRGLIQSLHLKQELKSLPCAFGSNRWPATKVFSIFVKYYTVVTGKIVQGLLPGALLLNSQILPTLESGAENAHLPVFSIMWMQRGLNPLVGSHLVSRGPTAHSALEVLVHTSSAVGGFIQTHFLLWQGIAGPLHMGSGEGWGGCQWNRGQTAGVHSIFHGKTQAREHLLV